MSLSNSELWNAVRKSFPNFASHTAEATKETFTENGFEKMKSWDASTLNDFFQLSMRVWLNLVNISHAKDPLENKGFGEFFENSYGGYIQRMATTTVKPVSPAYKGLADGGTLDPFVVRKPDTAERFFKQNFDYQSMITIPDEYAMKQIFVAEHGMSEFMSGIMEGLKNGYVIQKYNNKLEALNTAINSTVTPLKTTQKIKTTITADDPTSDELVDFLRAVADVISSMTVAPQTNAFNALGFDSTQEVGRLKLLVRPSIANAIKMITLAGTYNPQYLNLDVDTIAVPNFGGLIPYSDEAYTTRVYEVYDALGAVIGYNTTEGATAVTVEADSVYWKDPNEGVNAVLADKGVIFECRQNGYTVEPIRNPRGLYTNYWASSPNNTVAYDALYNLVTFNQS